MVDATQVIKHMGIGFAAYWESPSLRLDGVLTLLFIVRCDSSVIACAALVLVLVQLGEGYATVSSGASTNVLRVH